MRKIAVITGTRAEYGLLYWIIKGIYKDAGLKLQLIVTGMHLSPEFGFTLKEIEKDGFPIAEKVEMLLSSDTESSIVISMGLGMIGFAKAYERLKPDIIVVLGDRFEIFSAVSSALPFKIPVAHIHGGEFTEGAIDEQFRHAITKMSQIHFPSAKAYADVIKQMGESPKNIFCFGSPGLDNINNYNLQNKKLTAEKLGLPLKKAWGLITYHPVTLEKNSAKIQVEEIIKALDNFKEIFWIFTMPNADAESRIIIKSIEEYLCENSTAGKLFSSVGQINYLSLMKHALVMVGNSSSGIIEAPSFKLPVVNIGNRQKGRIRSKNILDVPIGKKDKIEAAVKKAISKEFKGLLNGLRNPYSGGNTSRKIVKTLKTISLDGLIKKQFNQL